ncbi:MAG: hypothetical protein K8R69_04605, partial [Deltaproteobacteria bacterium]|nr:hypothetical protein [Deltaproteobacteria bacterium]
QRIVQKNGEYFADIAFSGDAGAIVFRPKANGEMEIVARTQEQSLAAKQREKGFLKNTLEMRWSDIAHVVMGGLGLREEATPSSMEVALKPGDWTLMFSDGPGDNFGKEELGFLLEGCKIPEEARDRIVGELQKKMERLSIAQNKLSLGEDVFEIPLLTGSGKVEPRHMVPVDGLTGYYVDNGGHVVGSAVEFRAEDGRTLVGVEVPWAQGRFLIQDAKGNVTVLKGNSIKGLDYFMPVDRYKADNLAIHVYHHELAKPTNTEKTLTETGEEDWVFSEELGDTYVKIRQEASDPLDPSPTKGTLVSLANVPDIAKVGGEEIDFSQATRDPRTIFTREAPKGAGKETVELLLSKDLLGQYILEARGLAWGGNPLIVEYGGKPYRFSASQRKISIKPLNRSSEGGR